MGLTQEFARRKFRGAYTITVVSQELIGTAYVLDGNVDPVKKDTGSSVLRFSRRADLARFLRQSPPHVNTIYRIKGLDLSGQDFRGAQLQEVEFTNCNLSGADFTDATMLHARIKDCDLRKADFKGANLMSAILEDCDMTGVSFGVRNCKFMEMKWCTNPPAIGKGDKLQPSYNTHPKYTGPYKIRGLIRKLS